MGRTSRKLSKRDGYLIGYFRRVWGWDELGRQAQRAAEVSPGRLRCATCKEVFSKAQTHKDHIEPVVPLTGHQLRPNGGLDWNTFYDRLFCPVSNIAILCKACHSVKTKEENKKRREFNQKKKKSKGRKR